MRRTLLICLLSIGLGGCGGTESNAPVAEKKPAAKPVDEARRFPTEHRDKLELVDDHLLNKSFLPGGNLGSYTLPPTNKPYQQFLINVQTPQKASFLLIDYKNSLIGPKYLAHIGGYFGHDNGQPVYVFSKDRFLAGFVGLSEEEAEPLARRFAVALF